MLSSYNAYLSETSIDCGNRLIFQVNNENKNNLQIPSCCRRGFKKSLKISKGFPESVSRRSTDNTMAKRKAQKEQITNYKTYIKIKEPPNP